MLVGTLDPQQSLWRSAADGSSECQGNPSDSGKANEMKGMMSLSEKFRNAQICEENKMNIEWETLTEQGGKGAVEILLTHHVAIWM